MAIAGWAVYRDARIHEFLACGIDIVDLVGEVAEIAARVILFRVPVVRQFDLRVLVTGRCQENKREATLLAVATLQLNETELIALEVE